MHLKVGPMENDCPQHVNGKQNQKEGGQHFHLNGVKYLRPNVFADHALASCKKIYIYKS